MRILLADDHPVVRRHVRNILQSEEGWLVCAEAKTGREAVAMTATEHPDVVVLDLSMPELNGLQAARLIHERFPQMEMFILTMHEPFDKDELTAVGVRSCILKDDLNDLVGAIRSIGQPVTACPQSSSDGVSQASCNSSADSPCPNLTKLERQIVQLFAQARSTQEIADVLSMTVRAVDIHRAVIMHKLKVHSLLDLVHYAVRENLVEVRGNRS